ncbi:MAG: ethanolamine ammonia-lyase reactivating factor EutA [Chloroflexi bacterium]|nr:ethanolamine ammonia-lyase reactivating factor EutA [Chloroflexota bacterium]
MAAIFPKLALVEGYLERKMHEGDTHEWVYDPLHGYRTDDFAAVAANNMIELKSVGIDIGSSTSHLMFSNLVLVRQGIALSSRFKVVSREIAYRSDVMLTPYSNPLTIDTGCLSDFIRQTYAGAGLSADHVDTGAVIVTGEAAKKENAEAIVRMFSDQAGKFVCASAGPNLEAVMAAYGSGAVARSAESEKGGRTLLSVDVGGGTSKIAVVKNGQIIETAAINVGARLVAMDCGGSITRVEDPAQIIAREIGVDLALGGTAAPEKRAEMARLLADCLFNVLERRPLSALAEGLMLTPPITYTGKIDGVVFSGGVSEYIYGYETKDYGDLGIVLGQEIMRRARRPEFGIPVEDSEQRIRATVIGAAQYTLQVSGSTIFVSNDELLPLRNLQVMSPVLDGDGVTPASVAGAVRRAFQRFDAIEGERPVALAIRWSGDPAYKTIKALAEGVAQGLERTIANQMPVVLVFDADIGGMVGNLLVSELVPGCKVVSVDEIDLGDFDFIDIGQELRDIRAVPVVIKSLVFGSLKEKGYGVVSGSDN